MRKFSTLACIALILAGFLYFAHDEGEAQAVKDINLEIELKGRTVVGTASDKGRSYRL